MTLTRTATQKMNWTAFGAAALALVSFSLARPAAAAPAAAGQQVFGSVDILKVQSQSTRQAKYTTDLQVLQDRLSSSLKLQAQSMMLSAADQAELGTLLNTPRPTDAQRAQITALQTKASSNAQHLTDLQQKKDPTPADTAQLGVLTDLATSGQKIVTDIGTGYQSQFAKARDDDSAAFTQIVKEAIAAAARERGLTMVFTSDVAVYTTNDITEDVIKRINK